MCFMTAVIDRRSLFYDLINPSLTGFASSASEPDFSQYSNLERTSRSRSVTSQYCRPITALPWKSRLRSYMRHYQLDSMKIEEEPVEGFEPST